MQLNFLHYDFSQTTPLSPNIGLNGFGELTSHIGDGEKIWSEIELSNCTLEALKHRKLTVDRISCNDYHVEKLI